MRTRVIHARVAAAALAALYLAGTTPALAADDAAVEALIRRGIELRRNSADEDALAVFLEAERSDPTSVRVLLHVVTAAQGAGKWLMADSYMRKVLALNDDPYYRRHADAIDGVRRAIAARIGTLQVEGAPEGATVHLDGELLGTLPMAQPASIESGSYLMEVQKPGFYRIRRNVVIMGGVLTREPVNLKAAAARSVMAEGSAVMGRRADDVRVEGEERAWWQAPAVGWSLTGLGVAAGAISGIAFVTREQRVERWNNDARCVPDNGRTRESNCGSHKDGAERAGTIGVASGIAGSALIVAGIAHLVAIDSDRAHSDSMEETGSGAQITRCNAGLLSFSCQGSF